MQLLVPKANSTSKVDSVDGYRIQTCSIGVRGIFQGKGSWEFMASRFWLLLFDFYLLPLFFLFRTEE